MTSQGWGSSAADRTPLRAVRPYPAAAAPRRSAPACTAAIRSGCSGGWRIRRPAFRVPPRRSGRGRTPAHRATAAAPRCGDFPRWCGAPRPSRDPRAAGDPSPRVLRIAAWLALATAIACLAAAGGEIWRWTLMLRGRTEVLPAWTVGASDQLVRYAALAAAVLAVVAAAVAVPALLRAHASADRRAGVTESRRPAGVLARLIVPGWNLYGAGQVLTEIDGRLAGAATGLDRPRTGRLVLAWWCAWVVNGTLVLVTLARAFGGSLQSIADTVELHIAVDLTGACGGRSGRVPAGAVRPADRRNGARPERRLGGRAAAADPADLREPGPPGPWRSRRRRPPTTRRSALDREYRARQRRGGPGHQPDHRLGQILRRPTGRGGRTGGHRRHADAVGRQLPGQAATERGDRRRRRLPGQVGRAIRGPPSGRHQNDPAAARGECCRSGDGRAGPDVRTGSESPPAATRAAWRPAPHPRRAAAPTGRPQRPAHGRWPSRHCRWRRAAAPTVRWAPGWWRPVRLGHPRHLRPRHLRCRRPAGSSHRRLGSSDPSTGVAACRPGLTGDDRWCRACRGRGAQTPAATAERSPPRSAAARRPVAASGPAVAAARTVGGAGSPFRCAGSAPRTPLPGAASWLGEPDGGRSSNATGDIVLVLGRVRARRRSQRCALREGKREPAGPSAGSRAPPLAPQ